MKLITKTSLSVVALALIFAGGCSLNRPSEPVSLAPEDIASTSTTDVVASTSTEANVSPTSTVESIDTSDWKTYRNEEMGFEMKIPKEWDHFYEEKNIPAYVTWKKNNVELRVLMVNSTSSFDGVQEYLGTKYEENQKTIINGLSGYQETELLGKQKLTGGLLVYFNHALLKNGSKYYLVDCSAESSAGYDSIIYPLIDRCEVVFKTFKAL
jgi:hypothetical protein